MFGNKISCPKSTAKTPNLQELHPPATVERKFFIDNFLVRIHFVIVMIKWTGLAPWKFEFPFPGSLTSTSLRD